MRNNIKYLSKILLLISILFIIDYSVGIISHQLYQNCKSGVSYQEYTIINRTSQDVLIFGSSRAAYHYVPKILSDTLNLSVYNAGREGTGIFFQYATLIATMKRYNPKAIILDLDYRDIYASGGGFSKGVLKELAPFYGKISNKFDSLLVINWYDKFFLRSKLYQFNSKFFRIITGNLVKGRDNISGFRPLKGQLLDNMDTLDVSTLKIDTNKLDMIQTFINTAKQNNVDVILVVSPFYKHIPPDLFVEVENISYVHNIPFLNHVSDPRICNDSSLFADELHLNDRGAHLFSSIIAAELKTYFNSNIVYSSNK